MNPVKNVVFITHLIFLGILGCEYARGQTHFQIDLDQLESVTVEVHLEIGTSDTYFPAQLRELIVKEDGSILVADSGKTTIEQFDSQGNHIATIASEGNGPGELSFAFYLIQTANDTLIVWQAHERRADFYTREQQGIYTFHHSVIQEPFINQRFELFSMGSDLQFYAFSGFSDAELIAQGMPEYRMNPVAETGSNSLTILQDSLHMLKVPNYILEDPLQYQSPVTIGGLAILGMPPYRYQDRFRLLENGHYVIARPDSSALFFYNSNHEGGNRVDLNLKARPVTKEDLDFAFQNERLAGDVRIRRRLESYVSDLKPPFLNVWVSENQILLHTDRDESGKEMVVLNREGEAIGKFYLSEFDEVRHFNDNTIYTIHRDPLEHTIRVYHVNI